MRLHWIDPVNAMQEYVIIWEFLIEPGHESEFLRHYARNGSWAQLFRQAPGFVETILLQDHGRTLRYVTVDRWQSFDAWRRFREGFAEQYAMLDSQCSGLIESETRIGGFGEPSSGQVISLPVASTSPLPGVP